MTQSNTSSTSLDKGQLDYFKKCIRLDDIDIAISALIDIVEAEKQKFSNRLDELEKDTEMLKQVQVTRQEFNELKARVEELEKRQVAMRIHISAIIEALDCFRSNTMTVTVKPKDQAQNTNIRLDMIEARLEKLEQYQALIIDILYRSAILLNSTRTNADTAHDEKQ